MNAGGHLPQIDALLPPEMAARAEEIGVKKAALPFLSMFALAVLAGAFIGLGAIFATTVTAGSTLPFGVNRLLTGLVFSLGLILVIVGGAELFTGNTLIAMAFTSGKVSLRGLLRNWGIVYLGNLAGSIATAGLMFLTGQYTFGGGVVGLAALNIANAKVNLGPVQAVALGIMCNALVCLAVWLCFSARSTSDKILAIVPPITAFVACGFEHSVANMYFIPIAILIKSFAPQSFWELPALTAAGLNPGSFPQLSLAGFLIGNLLPVTIGNIIGGSVLVGLVYWFVYLRRKKVS
jgi:formate/nitrite transporter